MQRAWPYAPCYGSRQFCSSVDQVVDFDHIVIFLNSENSVNAVLVISKKKIQKLKICFFKKKFQKFFKFFFQIFLLKIYFYEKPCV